MGRGYIAIEGHGEVQAVHNLVVRLWQDLGLGPMIWATPPSRALSITTRAGVSKTCALARSKPDADSLLILRDADDEKDCPKDRGPETAGWVRDESLPFPCAVVLFRREYETLFLPCLHRMAGVPLRDDRNVERPGLVAGTVYQGEYESTRGVKEWLSKHMPKGRSYKPTVDQLALTRLIDFGDLRRAGLASFGTLERALRFLDAERGRPGVYPPPPDKY
ncbi:MAG: DUF4276 family protein [Isosphaeraceae bacterium]